MPRLTLEPTDTWFFRDGRPYHRDLPQVDAVTVFPPSPTTVVGAVRAAYARALGWHGGSWDETIKHALGDGTDLGPLAFAGPWLCKDSTTLYPAPRSLLRDTATGRLLLLRPAETPRRCDLGDAVRLPELTEAVEGKAEPVGGWITGAGLAGVLAGGVPEPGELRTDGQLFTHEPRTGHEADAVRGTITGDQALYSPWHVRCRRRVGLAAEVTGTPECNPDRVIPFGGEARTAVLEVAGDSDPRPDIPTLQRGPNGTHRYTVVLLTPMNIESTNAPLPGQPWAGLPGHVVSACLGRVKRIGGWDGVNARPRALRACLPTGSVVFMETESSDEVVAEHHDNGIGAYPRWGFGHALIGTW